jgi:hypothetical protein
MKIQSTLKDGELLEAKHPLDFDQTVISKRIGDRVFVTCYSTYSEEVFSARFISYKEWAEDQIHYYNYCRDSERHLGDGTIITTELI